MVWRLQQYYQATCIAVVPEMMPHVDGVVLGATDSFKCLTRLFSTLRHLLEDLPLYLWMGEEAESRPARIRNIGRRNA